MTDQPVGVFRVGIVGAGPAGLATAAALLEGAPGRVRIDLFDRRPTPFGLLRYGVAPDHVSTRQTLLSYATLFDVPGVRFMGGVSVGTDLTREDLLAYCRTQLTGYKLPRHIEFRDSLPKTPIGKILRRELRDEFRSQTVGH